MVVLAGTRRSPPELFLLALCLLSAASFLAGAQPPSSIEAVMPDWLVVGWYVTLVVAGVVGVAGNAWPGELATAWRLRLAGQLFAAGPAAAYTLAAFAYAGAEALIGGGVILVVGWSAFCSWQAFALARNLRRLGGAR